MSDAPSTVRILGTHGVPASYGGFETAAEQIGLHLSGKGWRVLVYCQVPGEGPIITDTWQGLERVNIPERREGWLGTSSFDLKSVRHAMADRGSDEVWLTFGYNTGVFDVLPRLRRIPNVINMDGMEWTRRRWGVVKQGILLGNERFAGWVGDLLVADHPEIARYLSRHFGRRRVVTIAYGAHAVTEAPTDPVTDLGLTPGGYGMVVCRPIPENSVTEIVAAWSRRTRGMPLLVVGPLKASEGGRPPSNPPRRADNTRARAREPYPNEVRTAASAEVQFPGAIFDPARLSALRHHAGVYLHGHTVGGTNPSLVEAMAAGNAVVAHDNVYNRWVAGEGNAYFTGTDDLAGLLDRLLPDAGRRRAMGAASRARHQAEFTWSHIGDQYEVALRAAMDRRRPRRLEKKGVSV